MRRKMAKWIGSLGALILVTCLLSGCQKAGFEEIDVTAHEVESMMEKKESFKLLVEKENCPFCEQLNAYMDESQGAQNVTVYRIDTTNFEFIRENEDDATLTSHTEEGETFLKLFPYFLYTPTIYTIEDGKVIDAAIGFNGGNDTMSVWNVDSSIDWDKAEEIGVWEYLEK